MDVDAGGEMGDRMREDGAQASPRHHTRHAHILLGFSTNLFVPNAFCSSMSSVHTIHAKL